MSFSSAITAEYAVPTSGAEPDRIVVGSDGSFRYTKFSGNHMTTAGNIVEYTVPTGGSVPADGIVLAPDGNLWFTEFNGNRIGKPVI